MIRARRRPSDPLAGFTDVTIIGRGSSATVHRAREAVSGQLVAVKVLDSDGGPDAAAFAAEARALARLGRHPNVVTLHRAELTDDGRPLLVLELCDASLADHLAVDGPLPAARVAAVGVALCGALETAHRAGIVHGAVSSSDVLVTRFGEVALADFGLAALTATGTAGSALDVAGDVDMLVAMLVELVTGGGQLPSDDEVDDVVTRELVGVLRRATADDPSLRPRTALELAQHLRAAEIAAGRTPTPCRVEGATDVWGPAPATGRRGRAAATTGLPPLGLDAAPLDPDRRTPPGPAPARRAPPSLDEATSSEDRPWDDDRPRDDRPRGDDRPREDGRPPAAS